MIEDLSGKNLLEVPDKSRIISSPMEPSDRWIFKKKIPVPGNLLDTRSSMNEISQELPVR